MKEKKKYSIGIVSDKTGLSTQLIRQWENRYNVIEPGRTDTNRRLYSDTDIYKLALLQRATKQGHSISNIVHLSISELEDLTNTKPDLNEQVSSTYALRGEVEKILEHLYKMELGAVDREISAASVNNSLPVLLDQIFAPLLHETGVMWREGKMRVAQEHYLTSVIIRNLYQLFQNNSAESGIHEILVTAPENQIHEVGALFAATAAASIGWRVIYPGVNLPAREIVYLLQETGCRVLFLSLVYIPGISGFNSSFRLLKNMLSEDVKIIVAGQATHHFKELFNELNVSVVDSNSSFMQTLDSLQL